MSLILLGNYAEGQTKGLVAHWKMEEVVNGVVKDNTGNGHDAAFGSNGKDVQPEFVEGMAGKAMKCEAAKMTFLTVKKSEDFNFRNGFTIMAWIKPSKDMDRRSGEIICKLFDAGEKNRKPGGWRLRCGWAMFFFSYEDKDGKITQWKSPAGTVPPNSWTHLTVTFDGELIRYYAGGVEKLAVPGSVAIQSTPNPLIIGNYIGNKKPYAFDGLLDEIKVFDRFLTQDEIWNEALPEK